MVSTNGDDNHDSAEVMRESDASIHQQPLFVRRISEGVAMGWIGHCKTKVRHVCRKICCLGPSAETGSGDVEEGLGGGPQPDKQHYRLETGGGNTGWLNLLSCQLLGRNRRRRGHMTIGINPNQQLAMYLHWMFRVNFMFLFGVMCVTFFVLVMIFAALIVIAGTSHADCVRVGGKPFGESGSEFGDAFGLSWTTFSTVGYGSSYPALGSENNSPSSCVFITFICSLESLLGVLYSGFCGAILFGKVLRIQSHAQVIFSDPIVIRYGKGVADGADDGHSTDDEGLARPRSHPCPVLEFRIVNRLFHEAGGEIMDATLNVVANVDTHDADPAGDLDRSSHNQASLGGTNHSHETSNNDMVSTVSGAESDYTGFGLHGGHDSHARPGSQGSAQTFPKFLDPFHSLFPGKSDHPPTDEDPTTKRVNKRIFTKMLIEASDHPFFKRVWLARHVLDDTSPILKPRVRRQIRRNGGRWPTSLYTWNAIRDSLQFNQILVSLNGVSNVSASDVYAQKIYDFVDVNVGYQFVNILYKDMDGALKVDTDLINDVREQKGGGGEPLIID